MTPEERQEWFKDNNPLLWFSLYTDIQFNMVKNLGDEIIQCMDESISVNDSGQVHVKVRGKYTDEAYSKFWFWTLGAYEVVCTMCEAKKCFTDELLFRLEELKKTLAELRIPFAKQELRGQKVPVDAELSIYTIEASPPDYKYSVKGTVISTRETIDKFNAVFGGIKLAEIRGSLNTMYPSKMEVPPK